MKKFFIGIVLLIMGAMIWLVSLSFNGFIGMCITFASVIFIVFGITLSASAGDSDGSETKTDYQSVTNAARNARQQNYKNEKLNA